MPDDGMKQPEKPDGGFPVRVLLGAADPARLASLQGAFRDSGTRAEFDVARSLREFRDLGAARRPDIAFLDQDLPGGDVFEALRSGLDEAGYPIVVLSVSGSEQVALAALKAGAADVVHFSPAAPASLRIVVDRVLREGRLRRDFREAVAALAESEAALQAVLQSTADGIIAVGRDGRVLYGNERFAEMWPLPPGEVKAGASASVLRLLRDHVADPDALAKDFASVASVREPDFSTVELKDGRTFDRVSRPLFAGRKYLGRVWSFTDVGEQIRTEAALRESEEIFRQFMKHSPIYVFFKDEQNRALRLSRNFETLLGRPLEELLGREMDDFFPVQRAGTMGEDDFKTFAPGDKIEVDEEIGGRHYATIKFPIHIEGKRDLAGFLIDITERKQMETSLRAGLREKEVLLQEVHHRVKNNMQVISSLFNIQARQVQNPECRQILKDGQARIRSMSLVHEKLYQSKDLSKIDLPGYIRSLALHLFQAHLVDRDQVGLEMDFEDIALDVNTAVPFGLILNELISNSLKHAFPKGRKGTLRLRLRRGAGGEVMLRVADDGVGFPEGRDFRSAESFGLKIINLLVRQLGGVLDLDRKGGTAFIVTFREPQPEAD